MSWGCLKDRWYRVKLTQELSSSSSWLLACQLLLLDMRHLFFMQILA